MTALMNIADRLPENRCDSFVDMQSQKIIKTEKKFVY